MRFETQIFQLVKFLIKLEKKRRLKTHIKRGKKRKKGGRGIKRKKKKDNKKINPVAL